MSRPVLCLAVASLGVLAVSAAWAQSAPPPDTPVAVTSPAILGLLALPNLPAKSPATLKVTSPSFRDGGDIPFENTQYRGNVFPGLAWTPGPAETRSYAVIMQDPDSTYHGVPILHWTMFNVPAGVTRLDPGMTTPPAGASDGPNIRGPAHPYMGPHTPPGSKHHYHFQLFALDTTLSADAGAGYDALVGAMKDHVLVEGELIGLAQADPSAPPRPAAPPPPTTPPAKP